MYNFIFLFLVFMYYSVFGYIVEVIYCSLWDRKLVNRGFLFGPYCPIYGVGCLLILLALYRYYNDPVVVFVFGIIITSAVEYYTSYLLEKIFHNKWWDYSDRRYNINGRICLENAIGFGFGALAVIYLLQPLFRFIISYLTIQTIFVIGIVLLIIFVVDCIASVVIAYGLRNCLIVAEELKADKLRMIPALIEKRFKQRISKMRLPFNRFLKAFPNLLKQNSSEIEIIKKWKKKYSSKKSK